MQLEQLNRRPGLHALAPALSQLPLFLPIPHEQSSTYRYLHGHKPQLVVFVQTS